MKGLLITGSHRSGTTWVGKVFSASSEFRLIYEPFNTDIAHKSSRYPFKYTFLHYKDAENPETLRRSFRDALTFRFVRKYPDTYNLNYRFRLRLNEVIENWRTRSAGKRPLVKDPIALFSADWFAEEFDLNVLVMVRHPLAFAASIKKAEWDFPFEDLIAQTHLMDRYFQEFRPEIEEFSKNRKGFVDQAILLWNLMHTVIADYQQRYSGWLFVKHENLVQDPLNGFRNICERFGCEWEEAMSEQILQSQKGSQTSEKGLAYKPRDPRLMLSSWKRILTEKEAANVIEKTDKVRSIFYEDPFACFESYDPEMFFRRKPSSS